MHEKPGNIPIKLKSVNKVRRVMKVNDTVERNGEMGTVMNIVCDIAYIWWHAPGKYRWEPYDIDSLTIVGDKDKLSDTDIDEIVDKGEKATDIEIEQLVDWVLDFKQTLEP